MNETLSSNPPTAEKRAPYPLVSADWLIENIKRQDVKTIDGSWRLDQKVEELHQAYKHAHIPGAVFFNIDEIADKKSDLPHMLPCPAIFAHLVGAMGLSQDDTIIIYEQGGLFSSPRVWWMFKAMGHQNVSILDGGLAAWRATGGEVTAEQSVQSPTDYIAVHVGLLATADDVRSRSENTQIFDARPAPRFNGEAGEPRAGLMSGAMPGALNLPASALIDEDGRLKNVQTLAEIFAEAGLLANTDVITSCGSGVTAAILAFGLEHIASSGGPRHEWRIYDGSWAEWGRAENDRGLFPVVSKSKQG